MKYTVSMKRPFPLIAIAVLFSQPGVARQDLAVCGTNPDRWPDALAIHRSTQPAERGAIRAAAAGERPAATDIGDIAVIEDSGGVVSRFNAFDLDEQTVTFLPVVPNASRYRFQIAGPSYDAAAAALATPIVDLGDDDSHLIELPFPLRFYGSVYQKAYINSDGNLTFGEPDTETSGRTIGRVVAGPPRIAPLFRDLDPTSTVNGVRVFSELTRVVVSWVNVPEFTESSTIRPQTFQLRLYADGRIEFAYQSISTLEAVVGIAPGRFLGGTNVVSFSDGGADESDGAIVEGFTLFRAIDDIRTAQVFYETHDDAYDYLVIYNDLGIPAASGAVAYQLLVRNHRTGYGDLIMDRGAELGSPRRLQAVMQMGQLDQYPTDPNAVVPARAFARDTPLTILGHEAGHLFLAFASVRDPNDPSARPMLGRQGVHWSFSFNSEASLLEGNRLCDRERQECPSALGQGRFVTAATVEGFSPLDQYLMGFRPPEEVPPTFLVENSSISNPSRSPQAGISFNGKRRDIWVDEIIQAEGRRTPDHTVSQRRFRFAFILIVEAGTEPSPVVIEKLDRYRREFEAFYHTASDARAWADTALRRELRLSTFPGAGVVAGRTMRARVSVAEPPEGNLDVLLASETGAIGIPPSVTIPAGAIEAEFDITGMRVGPDKLSAEVPGDRYMRASSPVQVLGELSDVTLSVVSGDGQNGQPGRPLPLPVVIRVADINNLPYPNIPLEVSVVGGGSVAPAAGATDSNGELALVWTTGAEPLNELTVRMAGDEPAVTVTATGRPFLPAEGIVNAASFAGPISPGALASMFGVNLAAGVEAEASFVLPVELAGVRVTIGGRPAGLVYVSDRQINLYVPEDTPVGENDLIVTTPLGASAPVVVNVEPVSPGIFVMPDGVGAAMVAGTGLLTSQRRARPGEALEVYATGLGAVNEGRTLLAPEAFLAGQPVPVLFSGLAPGWIGLYQVNVLVPAGLPAGQQLLEIVAAGVRSNAVVVHLE